MTLLAPRYFDLYFDDYEKSVALEDAKNDKVFENVQVILKENTRGSPRKEKSRKDSSLISERRRRLMEMRVKPQKVIVEHPVEEELKNYQRLPQLSKKEIH